MTIEEKWAQLIALLKVDYMLSEENDRIKNPKRNDEKYEALCQTWQDCDKLAKIYKGKLEGENPEFPTCCHLIQLKFPTENNEIILREIKAKLANAIMRADEVNIDTDRNGNVNFYFGFEDVYTERES